MSEQIKPKTLPGFMELMPNEQILFNKMKETIKNSYESYGFLPLDTPIIEDANILLAKLPSDSKKAFEYYKNSLSLVSAQTDKAVLAELYYRLGESYNIGGINEWANIDIVNLLCEKVDSLFKDNESYRTKYPKCPASKGVSTKTLITYVKDRLGHDRRYAIDATKIMNELNYKPQETFETGIQKTILWYLDNDAWWKKILSID